MKDVIGQRVVNQQLMMLTDEYNNFKRKANEKFVKMAQVIERQKQKEIELQKMIGCSPYMGTLMSEITAGDMKRYHRVAEQFPYISSACNSGLSTPARTQFQLETHNERLQSITAIPPANRLMWLDKEIGQQVKRRCIEYNSAKPGTRLFMPSPGPKALHQSSNETQFKGAVCMLNANAPQHAGSKIEKNGGNIK